MQKNYEVQPLRGDAARPFAVVATFRSFNRVIERYETEGQAKRRARDLNRWSKVMSGDTRGSRLG